ncbi:plasmid mobilization relaxosome protein MobC [Helicobacter saguini]|uniref:Plasmid mobilization relaxosome protein MobC n=1 Tax=Helicobacter saguini TaxID=1548018 RepID=A0A347VQD3_9HELI|nr:plasmid mobilization relaxosome protein MobC [Helicobacter saguini]MWV60988.1 plasmid mobilization relaxosome protein MobC [Helicobacter saguini]MWV68343.1 plasmid mobilization relaxosome protein MobC [Helicobacter saguini]MWV70192.1 plasmid mobilization relaxosome protein MobC [Helicobacter saguini]MWV72095.1 plasmid mobilization relaxosome protein MobC [Helicobacter saguini]TLD91731.1 plasmid mobilization relaxosome protein MobC [Helicobacter saguini]
MKKDNFLIFRLNTKDLEKITQDSKKLNLTKSQLLRLYIHNKKLSATLATFAKNVEFNNAMLNELSRIAGNINQIAYRLNIDSTTNLDSINEFKKEAMQTKKIFALMAQNIKESNKKLDNLKG